MGISLPYANSSSAAYDVYLSLASLGTYEFQGDSAGFDNYSRFFTKRNNDICCAYQLTKEYAKSLGTSVPDALVYYIFVCSNPFTVDMITKNVSDDVYSKSDYTSVPIHIGTDEYYAYLLYSGVYSITHYTVSFTGMYAGVTEYNNGIALQAAITDDGIHPINVKFPITYRPTNCTFPNAPTEAAIGDEVVVPVIFSEGFGLTNNDDIYVTCNGNIISSSYSNGYLTFIMPDPS